LAKWLPSQWSHHSIAPIEGTFGYYLLKILFPLLIEYVLFLKIMIYKNKPNRHLAPEYYTHGIVDEKTDVFAFGVFLLELISGKKPVDASHQSLHSWVNPN